MGLGPFSYFSANFSYFPGEAETYIFPIFFLFRAGGPKWGLFQANRIATLEIVSAMMLGWEVLFRSWDGGALESN